MLLTFEKLPENMDEFISCRYAGLEKPEYTVGLFLIAMLKYEENPDFSLEMLRYLKGPAGVSLYEKQFIGDRLRQKNYVIRSYFGGSSPQNNYMPAVPYTIVISKGSSEMQRANYAKLFAHSSGADNPRPVELRFKPSTGQWFLTEQLLLGNIRLPDEQNPWR